LFYEHDNGNESHPVLSQNRFTFLIDPNKRLATAQSLDFLLYPGNVPLQALPLDRFWLSNHATRFVFEEPGLFHNRTERYKLGHRPLGFVIDSFKRLAQTSLFRPLDLVKESNKRLAPRGAFKPLELSFELRERSSPTFFFGPLGFAIESRQRLVPSFVFGPLRFLETQQRLAPRFVSIPLLFSSVSWERLAPGFVFGPLGFSS
jgi:hypothetical protein